MCVSLGFSKLCHWLKNSSEIGGNWGRIELWNPLKAVIMAIERSNDLRAFKGFIDDQLASGLVDLTLEEASPAGNTKILLRKSGKRPFGQFNAAWTTCTRGGPWTPSSRRADAAEIPGPCEAMSFRVRLTKDAEADFERRLTILAERSPEAACRLNDRFREALLRLRDFPLLRLRYENSTFPEELRNLLFGIPSQAKISGSLLFGKMRWW